MSRFLIALSALTITDQINPRIDEQDNTCSSAMSVPAFRSLVRGLHRQSTRDQAGHDETAARRSARSGPEGAAVRAHVELVVLKIQEPLKKQKSMTIIPVTG